MTTIKSPVSTCGVNSGLCLPRKRRAISAASRPSTLPLASTRYQSRLTSCGLAERVGMALNSCVRDTAKAGDFIEEVVKCQTHFAFLELQKKKAQPRKVAPNPPKEEGGGDKLSSARNYIERSPINVLWRQFWCGARYFVRRDIPAESQRQASYKNLIYSIYYLSVWLAFDDWDNRQKG